MTQPTCMFGLFDSIDECFLVYYNYSASTLCCIHYLVQILLLSSRTLDETNLQSVSSGEETGCR